MKLREINPHRYCDDGTGTYFDLPLYDYSLQEAEEMIRADMECFLAQYPKEEYFGTDRMVLPLGRTDDHPNP